jgi:ABC-type bacteriocin/lantibiotic exporter with double-glycine peptidase domain
MSPLVSAIGAAVVLAIGGARIMDGWLSLGMLLAFQILMSSFLDPFHRLLNLGSKLLQVQGDLYRLDDVLQNPVEAGLSAEPSNPSGRRLFGQIEFCNVTFGYNPDQPLLRDFHLRVPSGSRIALVGATGSGKSTIAKLLAGLYRPSSGEIRFDGQLRDELARDRITNSVSLVDLDVTLIAGSFADIIALLDETLPHEAVVAAARDAAIHEEIMAKPGGYGFHIEEMGRNLSFGQRQRVDIARALAIDPRILILDEATSALDAVTEQTVLDNLRRRGCTCIVIAHRLSAIRDCDEIVVLSGGSVVERGSHQELMRLRGSFFALVAEE